MFELAIFFVVFGCVTLFLEGPFSYESILIGCVLLIFGLLFSCDEDERAKLKKHKRH